MSRTSTLILLGVLTILAPFSGLPASIRTLLVVMFGAGTACIGLVMRASEASAHQQTTPPLPVEGVAEATPTEMSSI